MTKTNETYSFVTSEAEEIVGKEEKKKEKYDEEDEVSYMKELWNQAWNRSYIIVFIFVLLCLMSNSWKIDRSMFDGKRIILENVFNFDMYIKQKTNGSCGWINANFGVNKNKSCSESFLIPLQKRYGCYLTECGLKSEVLCETNEWISREVSTSGCIDDSIRHICCRPLTHLCTWQGVWTSSRTLRSIHCQFETDDNCGKILCNNEEHKIFQNLNGSCLNVLVNGTIGEASCGRIRFPENSDEWFKKVDGYAVFDS